MSPLVRVGSGWVRLAGLSGAAAVALGAYGAHCELKLSVYSLQVFWISFLLAFRAEANPEMKKIYDTANFYHFVHTLALLAVPLTKRPKLVMKQ